MKKIIRNGNAVIAVLDDGTILQNDSCTDELFNKLKACKTDEDAALLLLPNLQSAFDKRTHAMNIFNRVTKSKVLSCEGSSIYWKSISELSMPQDFVEKILEAEEAGNTDALEAYKNFWTLLCLNPDERIRQNLFWFLGNWGMRISKTGLFVGYRNVEVLEKGTKKFYSQELCDFTVHQYEIIRSRKKATSAYWIVKEGDIYVLASESQVMEAERKLPYNEKLERYNLRGLYNELKAVNFEVGNAGDDTVYTDGYTHTMRIKIGEMVTMPREDCDCDSDIECSRGLHLGGTTWLNKGYFGNTGLVCLCNPMDVVAIPHDASYGKLRTCAYLPIAKCEYDANQHVIPYNVDDGFESRWVKTILYDGIMSKEVNPTYHIEIPEIPELNKPLVTEQVLAIARKYMK